jgi:hypothetical protein
MTTEAIFEQGVTHEVCEDYAISGQDYTILADGCSNGGGPRIHTDWGSRILCKAAEERMSVFDIREPTEYMTEVGITAQTQLRAFPNISEKALTATLSVLRRRQNQIRGFLVGDGVFGGKRHDGRWKIYVVEFVKGGTSGKSAPYYLRYKFCDETDIYLTEFGGKYEVSMYFGNLMAKDMEFPTEPITEEDRDEQWAKSMSATSKEYELGEGFYEVEFPADEYEFVFHCSDGPMAFMRYETTGTSKSKENLHVLDVLRVLMDIRGGSNPGFLRRQRHWAFKQDRPGTLKNRGWFGEDDTSVGVIYCGKP